MASENEFSIDFTEITIKMYFWNHGFTVAFKSKDKVYFKCLFLTICF